MREIYSKWNQGKRILFSRLSGVISLADNKNWERGLYSESARIEDNSTFKLLLDVRGYEFDSVNTHKFHRRIVPYFLARNNLVLAVLSDEDVAEIRKAVIPGGKRCAAVAMIHHDREKMETLDRTYGTSTERYFHDYDEGYAWLSGDEQKT